MCLALLLALFGSAATGAEAVRKSIDEKDFTADFYSCSGLTNHFGIVFLGGSEGGKPNGTLAKLFAENGYPTLALAYFGASGLPETLQSVPLEYFDKPLAWLNHNEMIPCQGVVVVGASRGAELALLLASIKSGIKGVIALAPSSVVWFGSPKELPFVPASSWTLHGKPVPYMPCDSWTNIVPGDMSAILKHMEAALAQKDVVANAAISVEQIHGPILLASGHDDKICPSEVMGDAICLRLKQNGFKYRYEHLQYPDAGHTLGFGPRGLMGGTLEGNAAARTDLTKRMLTFLQSLR